MQGLAGVNQRAITQKSLRSPNVANIALALEQKEKNKLARNIITYFVIALIKCS